jgi:hypothetical protein
VADRADRLPTFLVIGAQKAATTSLWAYLRDHPDVFLPELKELNFFAKEGTWDRGLGWYEDQFRNAGDRPVRGDISPGYTMFPIFSGVPARMASIVPDAKLIYLLRHPIERMVSSWRQSLADGLEHRPLRESLLMDVRYVSVSQYATQIERYLEFFDRSQLLVLKSEELAADPMAVLRRVCTFIGADPSWVPNNLSIRYNTGDSKVVPRKRTRYAFRLLRSLQLRSVAYRIRTDRRAFWYRPLAADEQVVDEDLGDRLADYLRIDLERLVDLCGPGFEPWGLLSARQSLSDS